jgi:hypothetical protein
MKRAFIFTGITVALALAGVAWGGWTVETVASQGDVGAACCLATDRWGRPHISYGDKTQEKAMYASYNGSSWEFETVASDVGVYGKTGLTFDSSDNPHILFLDSKAGELNYAYSSGSTWVTERIDGGYGLGETASIVVWPAEPRAAYYKLGYRYGYRDSAGWHTELITSDFGEFIRLFHDNENKPHVVYSSTGTRSIVHSVRGTGGWSEDNISEGIDSDAFFGPDNKIHVSFAGLNNNGLTYAVSTAGGSWKFETVPAVAGAPAYTQICVNVPGDVFISYFNFDQHNLHVMIKHNGTWKHERVATGTYVGNPHSIALGPGGYPLIAFYDAGNGDLKLARYDPLTDVELTSFTAERSRAGVDVRWAASGDEGVAGYNLYRAAAGAERERVNPSLIAGSSPFLYRDAATENAVAYRYWLEAVTPAGTGRTYGPASVPPAAKAHAFALFQNVPNPVVNATTFTFELAEGADVRLVVYDAAGRRVAAAAEGYYGPGRHDVPFQSDLAPGVYVYRIDAGSKTAARKMVVAR